jgi:hypothetical protein
MNLVRTMTVIAAMFAASPALAYIPATDVGRGWYDDLGDTGAGLSNYIAGECTEDRCNGPNHEYRNFFVFEVPLNRTIVSASLRLWFPNDGFASPTGSEVYQLFAVDANPHVLGHHWDVAIFDDLGSGTSYGAYTATAADEHTLVDIPLDAAAVADMNAATGWFAIGGAVTSLDDELNNEFVFGNSGWQHAYLVLQLAPIAPVPVPAAAWLLGSALLLLPHRARRR